MDPWQNPTDERNALFEIVQPQKHIQPPEIFRRDLAQHGGLH
jgi:hypothetical protein